MKPVRTILLYSISVLVCQKEPLCEQCFAREYCVYFQESVG